MIAVTRLDGQSMLLNDDLIESIEPTPDTLITMLNGDKLYVRETLEAIVERIVAFKRTVFDGIGGRSPQLREPTGGESWQ
jgi:flagellar protein FlbD